MIHLRLLHNDLNPLSMSTSSGRSGSPGLDTLAIFKLIQSEESEDENEVEDHIVIGNATVHSVARRASENGTDNPDEAEVDGLIDTFDVGLPEHSFKRISSWRASIARSAAFDFVNQARPLSPLPSVRKRKRSSFDFNQQSVSKPMKFAVDQLVCSACNSIFVSRKSLRTHGRRAQASEACREATSYAFE